MLEPVTSGSLAVRVRETILQAVLEHRFEDGRLPPEDELAEMLGVSRTTVRAALQSLEHHGVLTRSPGRGTVIHNRMTPSMVALQRLIGFAQLLREQGHEVSYDGMCTRGPSPNPEATAMLGLGADADCYTFERTLLADGKPAIWAIDVFPTAVFARELVTDGPLPPSPFAMDRDLLVQTIDHAVVELMPHSAGEELVEKLGLEPTEPCLLLKETHYAASGEPLGFSWIHVNDHFVRFQLIRRREGL